ncbi:NepR family anti-sigma factor [Mangrovicella endophytica]|uniref:NepR family anti-sigma factor n=1 Tax=Mangrovicella endophytica TaxID=2066697 RepID=UPI001FDEC1A4|nr:NepR family anti-sigma factor [Mangrovicella endophytica]
MDDREHEDATLQMSHSEASTKSGTELGPNSAIGKRLKAYYDDVASEPVPDRFLSLLDALDAAERASKADRE